MRQFRVYVSRNIAVAKLCSRKFANKFPLCSRPKRNESKKTSLFPHKVSLSLSARQKRDFKRSLVGRSVCLQRVIVCAVNVHTQQNLHVSFRSSSSSFLGVSWSALFARGSTEASKHLSKEGPKREKESHRSLFAFDDISAATRKAPFRPF